MIAESFYRPGFAVSNLCYQMEIFSVLVFLRWAVSPALSCAVACFPKRRILPRQGSYDVGLAGYGELCEHMCMCAYIWLNKFRVDKYGKSRSLHKPGCDKAA